MKNILDLIGNTPLVELKNINELYNLKSKIYANIDGNHIISISPIVMPSQIFIVILRFSKTVTDCKTPKIIKSAITKIPSIVPPNSIDSLIISPKPFSHNLFYPKVLFSSCI